jgi:hypothetical protein
LKRVRCQQRKSKKPSEDGFFVGALFGRVGQKTGLGKLQIVVFGEIHEKVPGHWLIASQVGVDHHALDTTQRLRDAPRGIT